MAGQQTTVSFFTGFGVPGDRFDNSPSRSQSWLLNSASAAYNVFGRAFTVSSQGVAQAGNPSGTAIFAGILINSKQHASLGDSQGTLDPTLTLPNNVLADLATMGSYIVSLPAGSNIGDWVVFDNTTGALATVSPGSALPSGKSWAHATVDRFTTTASSLAVIMLTPVNNQANP